MLENRERFGHEEMRLSGACRPFLNCDITRSALSGMVPTGLRSKMLSDERVFLVVMR